MRVVLKNHMWWCFYQHLDSIWRCGCEAAGRSELHKNNTFPRVSLCHAERYKKSHPEVLVHLLVENTRRCCAAVARGEVNLAIVGGDIPRELEHLIQVC